jgi:ubiquinone/menaquinone biosynthesis C-methylase UbiE
LHGRLADVTAGQVTEYYVGAQSYLTGALQGTCHFGYTEEGRPFSMDEGQREMERLLWEALGRPESGVIADAGSGYGRVAVRMAEHGPHVIGVELVPERIVEAQRFAEAQDAPESVEFRLGNFAHMPLADESVAAGYHMETLCHAERLEDVLAEWMRVLEPGGTVVFFEYTVPPHDSLNPAFRAMADTMVRNTGMTSIWRFTPGGLARALEEAGFVNVSTRDITRNVQPHWRWQFYHALRDHSPLALARMILNRTLTDTPNLAGSLMIWPGYRIFRLFGYQIVTATKPLEAEQSSEAA